MLKVAEGLKGKSEKYGKIISQEMRKPISQAIAEVEKCAWVCEYNANQAENQVKDEVIKSDANKSYVSYEPLGVGKVLKYREKLYCRETLVVA